MNKLFTQLNTYQPDNSDEIQFKEHMLDLLSTYGEQAFLRELKHAHFTASAWLVNSTFTEALLLAHKKLQQWLQPGGHADGNTDLLAVALKEAQEETGLNKLLVHSANIFDIDIHCIPAKGTIAEHLHYDVRFLISVSADQNVLLNEESLAYRWVGMATMTEVTDNTSIIRMANKTLNLEQYG